MQGTLCRSTASTNMNSRSSRSHAIYTITVEQRRQQVAIGGGVGSYNASLTWLRNCAAVLYARIARSHHYLYRILSPGDPFLLSEGVQMISL